MEVTSVGDFYLLLLMKLPMYGALALLSWKLSPEGLSLLSSNMTTLSYVCLVVLFVLEVKKNLSSKCEHI
jgi:NNP family nitrate/nitrite transporter-like MFS transporter